MIKKERNLLECWLYKELVQKTSLIDKSNGQMVPKEYRVKFDEIRFCTTYMIKKDYIQVVTINGKIYYKRSSLRSLVIANDNFIQISKDTIINFLHIDSRYDWIYVWSGEHKFKISRHHRLGVKRKLEYFIL